MGCCLDSREVPSPSQDSDKKSSPAAETSHPSTKSRPKPQSSELKIHTGQFVQKLTEPISNRYHIIKRLGRGSFGEVSLGENKISGELRAIKEIRKIAAGTGQGNSEKFIDEVFVLSQIHHPHVLRVYELFETLGKYYIVSEVLSGGELFDYLVSSRHLSESVAARVMFQLLSAVSYCHQRRIVHRDLKPENLLLESPPKHNEVSIKVIDFGTSCLLSQTEKLKQKMGTPYYIAPEVIKRECNEKCDVWSCGVILYVLLSGKLPFPGKTDAEILENVSAGRYSFPLQDWKYITDDAKSLIQAMLTFNYSERPSAASLLSHSWIQRYHKNPSLRSDHIQSSLSNLTSFRATQKLKHVIMAYIAAQYVSKEQTKALTEAFKGLDRNGDGRLSREELINGYRESMGETEAEETVQTIMETVDSDGSGFVDYGEFLVAAINQQTLLSKRNLEAAFSSLDSDNSGKISQQEMREMLSLGVDGKDEVWNSLIAEADLDGDGEIDLMEFMKLMLRKTELWE